MSVHQLQAYEDQANGLIKKFDKNGDGVLTKEELAEFYPHDARRPTQLNSHGSTSKISKANYNVDSKLSHSNAHTKPKMLLRSKTQKSPTRVLDRKTSNMPFSREHMKEIFKYHDSDKDGFLNVRELTKAFSFLGSILPYYKAHYGLAYADANNDGLISEVEFDKLIDYANKVVKK